MPPSKRVLFLCVQNACRSQMAEAFAREQGGDRLQAYSAGSRPSGEVNGVAIQLMREIGHDLSSHRSKSLDALPAGPFDALVTMGCGDDCPAIEATRREDWQIPDPKEMNVTQFREVRDLVGRRVRDLLVQLALVLLLTGTAAADDKKKDLGFVSLPKSDKGDYVLTSGKNTGRHWGRPEMIRALVLVAREWRRLYPDRPILRIGDISRQDGRRFPPHKTHRKGVAVDIFTRGTNICHVRYKKQQETLDLARLFFQFGASQILYNHAFVIRNQKGVKRWPKHDNHFHVVINPKKVPMQGGPILVPGGAVTDGVRLGPEQVVRKKDGTVKLRFAWQLLASPPGWQKAYRLEVDVNRQVFDGLLFDSERVSGGRLARVVSAKFPLDTTFYWRVTVFGPGKQQLKLAWQAITLDLTAPTVTLTNAKIAAPLESNPTLRWRSSETQGVRTVLELGSSSGRVIWRSGPLGGARSLTLARKLVAGRSYRWRVAVTDRVGNRGVSDWGRFKLARTYRWGGDFAQVTSNALNLRAGPGKKHKVLATLKKGQKVRLLRLEGKWRQVQAEVGGKRYAGYVWAPYLSR